MKGKDTVVSAMMIHSNDPLKFMKLMLVFCIYTRYFHYLFITWHITNVNHSGSYKNSNTVLRNNGFFLIILLCQFLLKHRCYGPYIYSPANPLTSLPMTTVKSRPINENKICEFIR